MAPLCGKNEQSGTLFVCVLSQRTLNSNQAMEFAFPLNGKTA
jgi:hypothetical protein